MGGSTTIASEVKLTSSLRYVIKVLRENIGSFLGKVEKGREVFCGIYEIIRKIRPLDFLSLEQVMVPKFFYFNAFLLFHIRLIPISGNGSAT